jgi:Uma2 family endonuclease
VRAADAAWVSLRRLNALSEIDLEGYASICPEFIIEIRSKSDSLAPLKAKMKQWIANGAEVAWLIDPIEKAITVYRPSAEPDHYANPTSVQGTGPIAGFELVLARIW